MGEVYRADDLKLGQPVALKFLPQAVQRDQTRLDRFLNEVKTALKVTHPNVCRVHDIGEVDGQHYLSMEYVDGEDLASLLRRIERLPQNKAVQIARQLCAGLAAAHEQGILHRDLKPANVMIDGRGRAKITDFGLAGLAEGIEGDEVRAGTPQYMSPEQHAGREVTVRSDIYSLGLVLYELFTGKRAFEASTAAEIKRLQEQSTPTIPSSHVEGLDPAVERIILRCLEKEPSQRPASALAIAAALPGGDPLAAALAAGETPSPDLVADAGGKGGLRPAFAVPLLILVFVELALLAFVVGNTGLVGVVQPEKPPEVLVDRAQAILQEAGYTEPPADTAYGFDWYGSYLNYIERSDSSPDRWQRLTTDRPSAIGLWYRQSPRPLMSHSIHGRVSHRNPERVFSGEAYVWLYDDGSLGTLKVVPPNYSESEEPASYTDWSRLFEAAVLDQNDFTETDPRWICEYYCEDRTAWIGTYPGQAEPEVRVEACAYGGKPVLFSVFNPWDKPWRSELPPRTIGQKVEAQFAKGLEIAILVAGLLLARRSLRLGRGDRRGAFRLACYIFLMAMLEWLFQASHLLNLNYETPLLFRMLGAALFDGAYIWLMYIALEPFVRRRWPEALISWNRALAGRLRDPLVGRDILLGAAIGLACSLWVFSMSLAPELFDLPRPQPMAWGLDDIEGTRWIIGNIFGNLGRSVLHPMALVFMLVLAQIVFRKQWLAVFILAAILAAMAAAGAEYPWLAVSLWFVLWAVAFSITVRFGIVVLVVANLCGGRLTGSHPLTLDFSAWYSEGTIFVLSLVVVIAIYGFYVSLAGRPLLRSNAVDGT
jgi:serine/threonine-protein kinase